MAATTQERRRIPPMSMLSSVPPEFERSKAIDDVLEECGFGWFTVHLIVVCGLGWLADTSWITAVIAITVPVQYEFGVSETAASSLLPVLFGAQATGALVFGPLADLRGRHFVFSITLLTSGLAGCVAAVASSFWMLILFIALAGFGVGGNMPVDGAIAIELCPKSIRGRLMTLLTVFWSLGGILMYGVAWSVIPGNTCLPPPAPCDPASNQGWRTVIWTISGLCLVSLLTRIGFPESPVWLASRGQVTEALQILQAVAARNRRVIGEGPSADNLYIRQPSTPPSTSHDGWQWLNRPWMKVTLGLLVALWFFSNFGYGVFNSMTIVLTTDKIGAPPAGDAAYRDAMIPAAAAPFGALLGAGLVDTQLGRKWTLFGGSGLMAVSLACFYATNSESAIVASSAFTQLTAQVMYAALYLYTPEILPTAVRGRGVAALSGVSRVAGIVAPLTGHALASAGVSANTIVAMSFVCMCAMAICAALLPIETRGCDISS